MNQKDFKNKSEMQIFLSYFKPHRNTDQASEQ